MSIIEKESPYVYVGAGSIWKISVLSSQFCCEAKTALKKSNQFKKKTDGDYLIYFIIDLRLKHR